MSKVWNVMNGVLALAMSIGLIIAGCILYWGKDNNVGGYMAWALSVFLFFEISSIAYIHKFPEAVKNLSSVFGGN